MSAESAPLPDRLTKLPTLHLDHGNHEDPDEGMCAMEAVSWLVDEPWTDEPKCCCPVIASFVRSWNDSLGDEDRNRLLLPLIPKLIGTRADAATEQLRSRMAIDWLIRTYTPAWLDLRQELKSLAAALRGLPPVLDEAALVAARPAIDEARVASAAARAAAWAAARAAARAAAWAAARAAAWDAAWDAARAAAWDAARAAAWDAARAAAWAAAWDAARAAAWDAAGDAARAAAWDAAWDAAWAAARAAAWDALTPTINQLQQDALALIDQMIAADGGAR